MQGQQQRKLHGIAANMMRLEKLKFHFLNDIQMVLIQTLDSFHDNQVNEIAIPTTINWKKKHIPMCYKELFFLFVPNPSFVLNLSMRRTPPWSKQTFEQVTEMPSFRNLTEITKLKQITFSLKKRGKKYAEWVKKMKKQQKKP